MAHLCVSEPEAEQGSCPAESASTSQTSIARSLMPIADLAQPDAGLPAQVKVETKDSN